MSRADGKADDSAQREFVSRPLGYSFGNVQNDNTQNRNVQNGNAEKNFRGICIAGNLFAAVGFGKPESVAEVAYRTIAL